jgi:hypothetical protein
MAGLIFDPRVEVVEEEGSKNIGGVHHGTLGGGGETFVSSSSNGNNNKTNKRVAFY